MCDPRVATLVILDVAPRGLQQLVVFHAPDGLRRRTSRDDGQVGDEQAEPDVRGVVDQLR